MIDFRYHLVSLVAVFLALAVGIVLGAGPLKDPIGTQLSQSVKQLRGDRDALSQQLNTAKAGIGNRDSFIAQIEPELVADQLGGRSVVLITLPGSDNDAVKPLTAAIADAGAKVTGRIDVQNAWVDPAGRAARNQAVQQLKTSLAGSSPGPASSPSPSRSTTGSGAGSGTGDGTSGTDEAAVAQLLARAVLTTEVSASEKTDQTERTLLDGLTKAGLIDVNGDAPNRATQAVVLAPGVVQAVDGVVPTPSPSSNADELSAWVTLARALDAGSTGVVVTGPASSATTGGVVAAIRAQRQVGSDVSTVDTGGTPMGDVTTVFALREQQLGNAGNYGFSDGATAPLPSGASSGG